MARRLAGDELGRRRHRARRSGRFWLRIYTAPCGFASMHAAGGPRWDGATAGLGIEDWFTRELSTMAGTLIVPLGNAGLRRWAFQFTASDKGRFAPSGATGFSPAWTPELLPADAIDTGARCGFRLATSSRPDGLPPRA